MRSREFGWLIAKDFRVLLSSKAYALMLLATGLLVGQAFLTAVETYAEMSGSHGGPAALAEGLSPLEGIVTPTFGALTLVVTLLLPFVVIRLIGHERQTGAWKLLAQGPLSVTAQLGSKLLVLLFAVVVAWLPAGFALVLWRMSGNHLDTPGWLGVLLGHALFTWLAIGVAVMAAAVTATEASAAIVTLGFTIGSWALDFLGAAHGGIAFSLAKFTPTATLRAFEHGLIRGDAIVVHLLVGLAAVAVAIRWLEPGRPRGWRWLRSIVIVTLVIGGVALAMTIRAAWDVSENRQNSFSLADEEALRSIKGPLRIEVHLAPEDPRLADLRTGVIEKLERLLPDVQVSYRARTRTGMFEQADPQYGESWYSVGAKRVMTHSATPGIVLETIYEAAGMQPPAQTESTYPGYPLVHAPAAIGWWFFAGWPLVLLLLLARQPGIAAPWRRSTIH